MFIRSCGANLAHAVLTVGFVLGTGLSTPVPAETPRSSGYLSAGDFLDALRQAGPREMVSFSDVTVRGRVHAAAAGLDTVRASILVRGLTFEDQFTLDRVVFLRPVHVSGSSFVKGVSMLDARFEQDVSFTKSSFSQHTTFKRTRFARAARFTDVTWDGMVSFSDALFEGETTDFTRAQFLQPAYFDQVLFANAASFRDALFELESSFKETRWNGDVDFAGARFGEEALFHYARFGATATFDRARFRREAFFDKVRFEKPVSFRDITFVRKASFIRAVFGDDADFVHCRFKQEADFSAASFGAPVHLNAYFARDLILRHATGPLADLRSIPEDPQDESADSTFADSARIYLHNADFNRMLFDWSQLQGRLAAADSADVEALEGAYGSVRRHLENLGKAEDARAAYREWMERRRRALSPWQAERIWLEIFAATTRYGTDLTRLLWWATGFILLFALVFQRLTHGPEKLEGFVAALYFSFCVFSHTSLPWRPEGRTRLWVVAEAAIGWLLLAGFIAISVRLLSS